MHADGHGRMPAVIAGEECWEIDRTHGRDGADRQLPAHQPADSGDGVPAVLGCRDGAPGSREQGPSGFCELDAACAAHEQVAAQFSFECADRTRQARLREVHSRRGPGEDVP